MENRSANAASRCMTPGCNRKHKARGLCASCHAIALRMVKTKGITWDQLMALGMAKPTQPVPMSPFVQQLIRQQIIHTDVRYDSVTEARTNSAR